MKRIFANRAAAGAMIVALAATLAACHPVKRSEPLVGPMTLTDPALERGRLLFDRHCYKCHLEGEGGLAPPFNDKPLPKFLMRLQTRVGLGAMPAFSEDQLSDAELDDLLNYIVYLRHHYPKDRNPQAKGG
ncbi:MAG TPA: cytochrome c [Burkholderiales bacterium]|nr:cytochrome c [Burkholderiales bacterium]